MIISVPELPDLGWTHDDGVAAYDQRAGSLTLTSAAGVDWINDADGGPQQHRATALAFDAPAGDWALSARVSVPGERTTFDAGALALWSHRDLWAKLCFEYSPQGDPMVVSVVTDRFSDDVNSTVVEAGSVFLRVARVGAATAFHASADGRRWDFVRHFRIGTDADRLSIGFLSQAPMGESCTAVFDRIHWQPGHTLPDLRDGS